MQPKELHELFIYQGLTTILAEDYSIFWPIGWLIYIWYSVDEFATTVGHGGHESVGRCRTLFKRRNYFIYNFTLQKVTKESYNKKYPKVKLVKLISEIKLYVIESYVKQTSIANLPSHIWQEI